MPLLVVKATSNLLRLVARRRGTACRDFFERVQQFAAEVVGCGCEDADARGELVVGDDGRDGDEEAGSGSDERFGDAGRNSAERSCSSGTESVKGIDHAHDGAEESDERAGGGDGGEPGQAAFERCDGFAGGGLRGPLEGSEIARWAGSACLALVGLVDVYVDLCERAGLVVVGEGSDFLQARGAAEGVDEVAAFARGLAEGAHLAEDDGPGIEAGDEQQKEDAERDASDVADIISISAPAP